MDPALDELLGALLSDDAYASGRRAFPRTVTFDAAVELCGFAQEQIDLGTAARAAAAEEGGMPLACTRGCNACCEEPVVVYLPEAERIARWLERPENAAVREAFLERYAAWRTAVGDAPETLPRLIAAADQPAYTAAHIAQWRRRVLCAFNAGGECTIYPVRPATCRNAHAAETSERCRADNTSGRPAVRLAYKPLDEFVARARRLEKAMHHALGGGRNRPEMLCVGVANRLAPRAPGPSATESAG